MDLKNPYKSSEWEQLHYLLAAWWLARYLNSLSLSFLYKIEIIRSIHFRSFEVSMKSSSQISTVPSA